MTVDRAFFEIVTAANMAGVDKAKAGFLGMSPALMGLTVALGALVLVGKSAIANTEAQAKANLSLKQAADVTKGSFSGLQDQFEAFAETNKRFIANQYDAETSLAAFIRTGVGAKTAMRELNVALDLSILKGQDMATAQLTIVAALAGNARGLKQLGITTEEYNAIWKNKGLSQAQKQTELLALMETRTKNGRKATTDLTQSTQALNKDWQDITTKVGPPLLALFSGIVGKVDDLVTALNKLGNNKGWNKSLSDFLGTIQNSIIADVKWVEAAIGDIQRLGNLIGGTSDKLGPSAPGIGSPHATGGPVSPGTAYMVGERGPEMLVMGSQGGGIIPNGGGRGGVTVNINGGIFTDGASLDRLANLIMQRVRFAPGT